jgi:Na+-translocating ferredoxin:NAD+ oxidoreductase RnfD subunit
MTMMREIQAPWMRTRARGEHFMLDVEIALLALLVFSFFCYGWRPVFLTALSVLSACVCELAGNAVRHQRPTIFDGSAFVTGTVIGLLMSPLTSFWVPMLASAFAIIVVKIPFGGLGRNIFNPAAAGMAIATFCFPTRVFTYPDATVGALPMGETETVITKLSPAAELAMGAESTFTFSDVIWGEVSGPIGGTAVLVLLAAAAFLFLRRTASPLITVPYLLTCAVIAVLFPRSDGGVWNSISMELCSGYLLFAGVFMFTDPVTAPRFSFSRVMYGVAAGMMVMLMRHLGRFEEGVCFAILWMNVLASPIDRGCWHLSNWYRARMKQRRKREGSV